MIDQLAAETAVVLFFKELAEKSPVFNRLQEIRSQDESNCVVTLAGKQ